VTGVVILDGAGAPSGHADLSPEMAAQAVKPHLIHETVSAELAARRAGTHSTLTRGKVRGGGRKPWRQKGTGRARQGSIRAPQWTGGGIVFGPQPRSYAGKVNRKVRRQALLGALRAHVERGTVAVMDPTGWDAPSTKRASAYLRATPERLAERPLVVCLDDPDGVEGRSFRNLAGVDVVDARRLETADVMSYRAMLVERAAWERLTGDLGKVAKADPGALGTAGEAMDAAWAAGAEARAERAAAQEEYAKARRAAAPDPEPEPEVDLATAPIVEAAADDDADAEPQAEVIEDAPESEEPVEQQGGEPEHDDPEVDEGDPKGAS